MDSFVDDVNSRIDSLKNDDFSPTCVVLSTEKHAELIKDIDPSYLESEFGVNVVPYSVLDKIGKDYVVCFEDEVEDSPLGLPSPGYLENMVQNLEFHDLDPEVAKENGYDEVTEDDISLTISVFADIERKRIDVLEKNIEELGLDPEEFPLDEQDEEAEDGFTEQIEFAVVSKDYREGDELNEVVKEEMRESLKDQMAETLYKGEYVYPYSYQPDPDEEKVRVGEEVYEFSMIMLPQDS